MEINSSGYPFHKSKFYKKLTTTTGKESSISLSQNPSFHPQDFTRNYNSLQPIVEDVVVNNTPRLPRESLMSKFCNSIRQFNRKCYCVGIPCIDRFISSSRRRGKTEVMDLNPEKVRYRRPKSQRQLQLSRKSRNRQKDNVNHHKDSYERLSPVIENLQEVGTKPMELHKKEEKLKSKSKESCFEIGKSVSNVSPRGRLRKMYTSDRKLIHYVIPYHSDSSLSDNNKMTQVNSKCLIKIQQTPEPSSASEDKTFEPSLKSPPNDLHQVSNSILKKSVSPQQSYINNLEHTANQVVENRPTKLPTLPSLKNPPNIKGLDTKGLEIPQRPTTPRQKLKQKFENIPCSQSRRVKFNSVAEVWYPGPENREEWDNRSPQNNYQLPTKKDLVNQHLHLKYGRFPKVIKMKMEKSIPSTPKPMKQKFGKPKSAPGNLHCDSLIYIPPETSSSHRQLTSMSPTGSTISLNSYSPLAQITPEIRLKLKKFRNRSLSPNPCGEGDMNESFDHIQVQTKTKHQKSCLTTSTLKPTLTKRLNSAVESENWYLANQLLFGNLVGADVLKTRPNTSNI